MDLYLIQYQYQLNLRLITLIEITKSNTQLSNQVNYQIGQYNVYTLSE